MCLNDIDQELLTSYQKNQVLILSFFTSKVIKTKISPEQAIASKILLCYFSIEKSRKLTLNNKLIRNLLFQRPPSLMEQSENDEMHAYFANFRLDHRILRSKLKQTLINNNRPEMISFNIIVAKQQISTTTKFSLSGSRVDFVNIISEDKKSSYESISKDNVL